MNKDNGDNDAAKPAESNIEHLLSLIMEPERRENILKAFLALVEEENADIFQRVLYSFGDNEDIRQILTFLLTEDKVDVNLIKYIFVHNISEDEVVDINGMSPLQRAAKTGNLDVIKLFLNGGEADQKRKDNSGTTALALAAKYGHIDVVDYLARKGSDIDSLDVNQMSPLLLAVDAAQWGVVKYLVGHGAAINGADEHGVNALQRVVDAGEWAMVNYLIGMGADVNIIDANKRYPLQNVVGAGEWVVAKHMVEKGAQIGSLTSGQKDTLLDVVVGECGEEYEEFYNVIRLSNIELFDLLIRKKGYVKDSDKPDALKKLEALLSEAYEALKVRNVPLSLEMEFAVENKILDSRFFIVKDEVNINPDRVTIDDVNGRIGMIIDWIKELNLKHSGDDAKEFREEFLIVSRFVAQNIRVLKRQLRSTYNKLPWEEIEFCLSAFISSYHAGINPNNIYRLVLDETRILAHLTHFLEELTKQKYHITESDINSKFPLKQDLTLSARRDIVKSVINNNPLFEDLYNDFRLTKNLYSLQRIESYIKIAFSVDINEHRDLGKLVIERTLQVIGESLKNTLESPNVSDDIHDRLLLSAPKNIRMVISSLRDSLSHSHSMTNKLDLEENNDLGIFVNIRNDLDKINVEIVDILSKTKLQLLKMYANKITNSNNLEEMKKLGKNVEAIDFRQIMSTETIQGTHLKKLKIMIDKFSQEVKNRTEDENEYFDKINTIIDSELSKISQGKTNFTKAVLELKLLITNIHFASDIKHIQELSKHSYYLDTLIPHNVNNIMDYTANILSSYRMRISPEEYSKVVLLTYNINMQVLYEVGGVRGLDELTGKLENRERERLDNVERNIHSVFDDVERGLETEQDKTTFRIEVYSNRKSYEAKQDLKSLLKYLEAGSISVADESVSQKYEDLSRHLNLKRKKKENILDKKFYNSEWEECYKALDNLRDNYEIFLSKVKKSLEKDISKLPQHFKSLFKSLFKSSELLKKLNTNIDNILQENPKQLEHFFEKRLKMLSRFISTKNGPEFLQVCKQDRVLKAAIEVIVLDLTEILESVSLFGDNLLFLDQFSPLLIGKSLRNYLAHGDALVDVLPVDPTTTLVLTALKLIKEGTGLTTKDNVLIGRAISDEFSRLNSRYNKKKRQFLIQETLFSQAYLGDITTVKESIAKGGDINGRDNNGMNCLHFAAAADNLDTLDFFLVNNISISSRNINGLSILHASAINGSFNVVKFLMETKLLPVDQVDNYDYTPLVYAATFSHADIVEALLENGANIESTDEEKRTALHLAAIYGFRDVVQVLLAKGANMNALCNGNVTPLHLATSRDHTDIVDILLQNGAREVTRLDINVPLLNSALHSGHLDSAKLIMKKGTNVNEASNTGFTPLHMAARFGQIEMIQELLVRGAVVDAQDVNGWTPLDFASLHEHSPVARLLLDNGAIPSKVSNDDRTALHFAATAGVTDIVGYLLDKGAKVNSLTKDKTSALKFAATNGHKDVVVQLLDRGANPNIEVGVKMGSLHCAAFKGHKNVVIALLERGANVDSYDDEHCTPLHYAIIGKKAKVVEVLLDYEADINVPDTSDMTPLMYAAVNGSTDIVHILLRMGASVDCLTHNKVGPLHMASTIGNKDIVEMLLKKGVNIDIPTNDKLTPLHYAAMNSRRNVVKFLLERGANVNALTKSNMTPLHLASLGGHIDTIELLVANGANIDAQTNDTHSTPLEIASVSGHLGVVEALIRNGANVLISSESSLSPMRLAIKYSNENIVKFLLDKGADVNSSPNGIIPLQLATFLGEKTIVELLLDKGADINIQDENGNSCLHFLSQSGKNNILVSLLQRGADVEVVNNDNNTSLIVAAMNNHIEVVESLLDWGASVNSMNKAQMTALHFAARGGYIDVVNILLKHKANVNVIDGDNRTPLLYAAGKNHKNVIDALLQNGSKVDSKDKKGNTALHYAAAGGCIDVVNVLLKHKANVNEIDGDNQTPLMYAAGMDHKNIIDALLQNGSKVDSKDKKGNTALHYAAAGGYIDVVNILLKHKANVNVIDGDNRTPLIYAAGKDHKNVIDALLQNGSKVDSKDKKGNTALHYAAGEGYIDVVNILLKHKANVNVIDGDNLTPLLYAARKDHKNVIDALLQNGSKVDSKDKKGNTALHYAAENGSKDIVLFLLENRADINKHGENELTPLHILASKGLVGIVDDLIAKGADVDAQDSKGSTPLFYASQFTVVVALLQAGANVNARNNFTFTALHSAAINGHTLVVNHLLAKGSDVDAASNKNLVALHLAAEKGHLSVVTALLDYKANVDIQDRTGFSALRYAAENGYNDVANAILAKGAKVDSQDHEGSTALHGASNAGYSDVVETLLRNGANVNFQNNDHWTPLIKASLEGHINVVKILLKNGAAIEAKLKNKWTPLFAATIKGHIKVVNALLSNGADVEAFSDARWTSLHAAASQGYKDIVNVLCGNGANVHARTNKNLTALHLAVSNQHSDTVKTLLELESDVDAVGDENQTSLHFAAFSGDLESGNALLAKNAKVNVQMKDGFYAIHCAAEGGHKEFVEILLKHGVNVDTRSIDMLTPLHVALHFGRKEVVFTLLDCGADLLAKNNHDSTLHRAVSGNNVDVLKYIIDKITEKLDKDPVKLYQYLNAKDAEGDTPLMWTGEFGRYEAGKILLESGADINAQNNSGMTALHWAAKNGHLDSVNLLIGYKANVNLKDLNGNTAFQVAQERSSNLDVDHENYKMISALLLSVTDVESIPMPNRVSMSQQLSDADVRSLETLAASIGASCNNTQRRKKRGVWECSGEGSDQVMVKDGEWEDVVRWLVEQKRADVNAVDPSGRTILHRAVERGNLPLVKWLVDKGADMNGNDNNHTTILQFAFAAGKLDLVKWAVEEMHVRVNDVDKFGRTALHIAAIYGYTDLAKYFLAHGGNLHVKDINEDNAEDLARKRGHRQIIVLLQKADIETNMHDLDILKGTLVELRSEQERLGLELLDNESSSRCGLIHRRKRKVGSCNDENIDHVFPFEPLDESEYGEIARWAKLYNHVVAAVTLEHPQDFCNGNLNGALDKITTYNVYVGEIISEGKSNHSPREHQILSDHYDNAEKFFKHFPENSLINEIENGNIDGALVRSLHNSWLFRNDHDSMSVLSVNGRFQLFSNGFNYKLRFQTRVGMTLGDVESFVKAFFKWRSGNIEYKTFTLVERLSEKVISMLKVAPFWTPDKVAPDGILLAKEHLGLIELIPAEIVHELFFVDGKSPDITAFHSDFFKHHQGNISLRLEILHRILPSLSEQEVQALVRVVRKYDCSVKMAYANKVLAEERSIIESYQDLVAHELQTAATINLEKLSGLSWAALKDGLERHSDLTNELSEKIVSSIKDLHAYSTKSAWAKGMATQTMFFLPDMIRATNSGDVTSLAHMGAMLTGDATINNLYTGLVNNLEAVLPEGRIRILRALPVTSPVFKALTVYSIVELTKQLHSLPSTSETRSVIEHKLGEQYMTAGLMVAEMLGLEVTPLWIGLIAEQLIFDADTFRKQNHLDLPFWEAFLMSLGYEQDKLRTVLEVRQLVEMNLSMVNKVNLQSANGYGWVIVKVPKLGELTWKDVSRDQVSRDIRKKVNAMKADDSSKSERIFTAEGFRLVHQYKVKTVYAFSTFQVIRGKLLKSFWQKGVYRADVNNAKLKFSLHPNDSESFTHEDNVFLDERTVDNVPYKRVPSISGGRFTNGFDPLLRAEAGAAVYANNQTYTDVTAQSSFYAGFDPREGKLELEFSSGGLEKIDELNMIHNLSAKGSKMYNSYKGSSPYIVTVQVSHKPYPEAIEFSHLTGNFSLIDKSKRVVTQYLIAGDVTYLIKDESLVTKIVLSTHLSRTQNYVSSICNTINDDGPQTVVIKHWLCTEDGSRATDKENQLMVINEGTISLNGYRNYLQLYLSGHLVERQLSLSAKHVEIIEAEGKAINQSKIQLGEDVGTFNITIRGDIFVNHGATQLQLSGKVPNHLPLFNYSKTLNKLMSFYYIGVNDLRPILKSISRIYTTLSKDNFIALKFSTASLNCTWQNTLLGKNSLKLKGYLDGKSAVLGMELSYDVVTIFESETLVAGVDVRHYDHIGIVRPGLELQDVYVPTLSDSEFASLGSKKEIEDVSRLKSIYGPGTILTFLSPEGIHVNHWFPRGDKINVNGVDYRVKHGHICAVDGNNRIIDGSTIMKYTERRYMNRMNVSTQANSIGVCFEQTLKESRIDVKNGSLVVNEVILQNVPDKTSLYFAETDILSMKVLLDTLFGEGLNITTTKRKNVQKRSVSDNVDDIYGNLVDFPMKLKYHNISMQLKKIIDGPVNADPDDNDIRFTGNHSAQNIRIGDFKSNTLKPDHMSTLTFEQSEKVIHDEEIVHRFKVFEFNQLEAQDTKTEENYEIIKCLERLDSQIVSTLRNVIFKRVVRYNGNQCYEFDVEQERNMYFRNTYNQDKLLDILKHNHTLKAFILLVRKLYNDVLFKKNDGKEGVFLYDVDKCFSLIFNHGIISQMMKELNGDNVVEGATVFGESHRKELLDSLRDYFEDELRVTLNESRPRLDSVNTASPGRVTHKERQPRLDSMNTASPENVRNSATSVTASSINKIFNWLTEMSVWIVSSVLEPFDPMELRTSGENVASTHDRVDDALFKSSPSYSTTLMRFNLNETIVLVDFLVRCFTKGKEPSNSSRQHEPTLFEAQVFALQLTSAFDDIIEQQSKEGNVSGSEFEFNPVNLQTRLIGVIRNSDCSKIPQILFESLENKQVAMDDNAFQCLRERVMKMLSIEASRGIFSTNKRVRGERVRESETFAQGNPESTLRLVCCEISNSHSLLM